MSYLIDLLSPVWPHLKLDLKQLNPGQAETQSELEEARRLAVHDGVGISVQLPSRTW